MKWMEKRMGNKMIHTPEGVRDIYGKEFLRKSCIKEKLHESLSLYGFQDIETPSFEFSDVYSNDVGTTPEKEMYRFFDKEGSMLVLRPDFTPSIARSASKYFLEDDMPVRLCYEGNVFNNTHDLQGKLKESTQMGAELIGDVTDPCIDGEMLCLVVESLLNVGFTDFQVCIGNVEYFKGICDKAGFDEDMIKYACSKTVIATDSHRLEYCEGILKKWFSSGILTLEAAKLNDDEYSKQKSNVKRKTVQRVPKFAQFAQRDYDYDALVKELAN